MAAQTGRAHWDTTKPCRLPSPIPGFRAGCLAYSSFPDGRPRLFQASGRTASPIPGFRSDGLAYSRFPGRNERHRAGIGREPWNPHERKNESPCSPWYRGRAHLPHQVFRPIPLPHEVSRPTPPMLCDWAQMSAAASESAQTSEESESTRAAGRRVSADVL